MDGGFHFPVDPLAGGALNLRLAVQRLDLADALSGWGMQPELAGRLTARLRVTGNAGNPKIALSVNGHDLNVRRSASAAEGPSAMIWARPRRSRATRIARHTPRSTSPPLMAASCASTPPPGSTSLSGRHRRDRREEDSSSRQGRGQGLRRGMARPLQRSASRLWGAGSALTSKVAGTVGRSASSSATFAGRTARWSPLPHQSRLRDARRALP